MLLTSSADLERVVGYFAQRPFIALDTEFQWQSTYFARLGLVQIADEREVALVDCVAVTDISPLRRLIADSGIAKVIHSASQDLPILARIVGEPLEALFDSQIAAAFCGARHQLSYADLVRDWLGIQLDKSNQLTDWLKRPLTDRQLEYAESDVVHLARLYPLLRERLLDAGRLQWVLEDSEWLCRNFSLEESRPEEAYRSVRGYGRLRGRELLRLMALSSWREKRGRAIDRRPRRLVPDAVLLAIARRGRMDSRCLAEAKPYMRSRIKGEGEAIREVLASADAVPDADLPSLPQRRRISPLEKELLNMVERASPARPPNWGSRR